MAKKTVKKSKPKKAKPRPAKKSVKKASKPAKKAVKKAAKKSKKKAVKTSKARHLVNFKIDNAEQKVLMQRAKKFAKGNLSAWLRYAGSKFVPPKNAKIG